MHLPKFLSSLSCSSSSNDETSRPSKVKTLKRKDLDRKDLGVVSVVEKLSPSLLSSSTSSLTVKKPSLTVMGMGCSWPKHEIEPKDLEDYAAAVYDVANSPGLQKLLALNRKTGIKKRSIMWDNDTEMMYRNEPPNIQEVDQFFRKHAVPLTVESCQKAIKEWGGNLKDITHVVGVTATNAGNPGFDQLVSIDLGLRPDTDRTLIHGVGCSGGLAALRAASNIASGASARGVPARILMFATELCSPNVRCDFEHAVKTGEMRVGPTLFSDGSSALILCNELAGEPEGKGIYQVIDWKTWIVPNTQQEMNFLIDPNGFKVHLSKNVAPLASGVIAPSFKEIMKTAPNRAEFKAGLPISNFDWALHPGGLSILKGAEKAAGLTSEQLRASYDVYENRGNSSSVAVLATMDRLREMGHGKDDVIACSFGPGMTVEMATLKRCRPSH